MLVLIFVYALRRGSAIEGLSNKSRSKDMYNLATLNIQSFDSPVSNLE